MKSVQAPSKIILALSLALALGLLPFGVREASATEVPFGTAIVGINQNTIDIAKSSLPGFDSQVAELKILRLPVHGILGSTGPVALQVSETPLTYQPSSTFWSLGTDSFAYELTRTDGSKETSALLLVAGHHRGQRVCHQDFEGGNVVATGAWSIQGAPSAQSDAAVSGSYGMRAFVPNSQSQTESSVRCTPPFITQREGSQMRVSVTVPDPASGATGDTTLLSAENGQGDMLLKLLLVLDHGEYTIHGEIYSTLQQTFVATASWAVSPGDHKVDLDWWPDESANNDLGGVSFWGDGKFVDRIFESQDFDVDDLVFTYGLQGYTGGGASIDLDDLEVWQGPVEAAYQVHRADGFEDGLAAPWQPGPGTVTGLEVNQAGAITGAYGLESDLAVGYGATEYFLDDAVASQRTYGARFLVDTRSASLAGNDMVLLLDLLDQNSLGGATEHAKVTLRKDVSGTAFKLQVRGRDGGTLFPGSWNDSAKTSVSDGVHTLEILWSAASRPGGTNGYLRLWLDGSPVAGISSLANYGRTVESVLLGTLGIGSTSAGALYLDDFEAWSPF